MVWNFKVGQKVVCVDDTSHNRQGKKEISKGNIYTIRWIGPFQNAETGKESICVKLVEVYRGPAVSSNNLSREAYCSFLKFIGLPEDYMDDLPFRADRFKPLDESKKDTSIEVFKKLLTPVNKQLEDA